MDVARVVANHRGTGAINRPFKMADPDVENGEVPKDKKKRKSNAKKPDEAKSKEPRKSLKPAADIPETETEPAAVDPAPVENAKEGEDTGAVKDTKDKKKEGKKPKEKKKEEPKLEDPQQQDPKQDDPQQEVQNKEVVPENVSEQKEQESPIEIPAADDRKTSVDETKKKDVKEAKTRERRPTKTGPELYVVPPAVKQSDVEAMRDLDEKKIMELREAFLLFDLDKDGVIGKEDLRSTFMSLGQPNVTDDAIESMIAEAIDPLDFDSFVVLMGYKTIELDPEEVIREALSQWDRYDTGLISHERIRHDLIMWGDRFTDDEADYALEEAIVEPNTKGMVDYAKFCNRLCGLRKRTTRLEDQAETTSA